MMRVSSGDAIPYTPTGDLAAGSIVDLGSMIGIADRAIAAGERGALSVRGLYLLPRISSLLSSLPAGSQLYWLSSAGEVRTTPSGGAFLIGKSIETSPKFATTILVLLSQ